MLSVNYDQKAYFLLSEAFMLNVMMLSKSNVWLSLLGYWACKLDKDKA